MKKWTDIFMKKIDQNSAESKGNRMATVEYKLPPELIELGKKAQEYGNPNRYLKFKLHEQGSDGNMGDLTQAMAELDEQVRSAGFKDTEHFFEVMETAEFKPRPWYYTFYQYLINRPYPEYILISIILTFVLYNLIW